MHRWLLYLALLYGFVLLGCGSSTATVSGKIEVDGKPLEKGTISFTAAEGDATPVSTAVKDGAYSVSMPVGKKRVQVSAQVVVDRRPMYKGPDAPMLEVTEEGLPPEYNSQTTLTFDAAGGGNTMDLSLVGKKLPAVGS
jgi:hypothetical protein